MDDLKTLILTLSAEDKKEFSVFIRRQKNKKQRKDLELFRLLAQKGEMKPKVILAKLYPEEANVEAYHALRKRLMRHLMDFILLKRLQEDTTATSSVMGLLSLARYLFEKQVDKFAWSCLRKAEKMASESEHYALLNSIYNLQIEQSGSEFADGLDHIIEKRNANKLLADEDERASIANSLIHKKLNEVRIQGRGINFDSIIQEILAAYQLLEAVGQRPVLLYKLLTITRSAVLVRKDFYAFEPYVIERYHQTQAKAGFWERHYEYKIGLLYMIAHVLYRNRKFEQSNVYLNLLYTDLNTQGQSFYNAFYPKYVLLLAANYSFLGQPGQAITLLEELLQSVSLQSKEALNAQINLSFYCFQQETYAKANKVLLSMGHSDAWCEKKMGKEWVLKKNLSELILQYELGNIDLVLNKIRAIERNLGDLVRKSAYRNVQIYIQFVKQFIAQPDLVTQKSFFQEVDSSFEFMPIEQEDLQAMSFYAWLKSKMVKRKYYDVLLELTHQGS